MPSGARILRADGSRALSHTGAQVLDSDIDPCEVCTDCVNPPGNPTACGNHETCNKYCNPRLKSFNQSLECGCPCPGHKDYPKYYRVTGSLGSVRTDKWLAPDGHWYQITSQESVSFVGIMHDLSFDCFTYYRGTTPLESLEDHTARFTFDVFDTDGVTPISTGNVYSLRLDVLGFTAGTCAGGLDTRYLYYLFAVVTSGVGSFPFTSPVFTLGTGDPVEDSKPRCDGGEITAIIEPDNPPNQIAIGLVAPSVSVVPWCRDCDDAKVEQTGDLATICGGNMTASLDVYDDGSATYVTHTASLTGSATTGWTGVDQTTGAVFAITNTNGADGDFCCPGKHFYDCTDCPDTADDASTGGPKCTACWRLSVIVQGGCLIEFYAKGSCPPEAAEATPTIWGDLTVTLKSDSGCSAHIPLYQNMLVTFVGNGCPEEPI